MEIRNIIKTVILCRVSSKEQEETGYSLDAQEKLLTDYANKNNFEIIKVYRISESASGKQLRKTFNEVLEFTEKNKVNVLLCEKIDRLTRNLKDAAIIDDWIKKYPNRSVHFVKENFVLNMQTRAHDNLVWDMKVAIARFYTNNLSEEVKKGQKEKLAQGWLPVKPPLGYKSTGTKGHITHFIDQEKAPLMKKMFELYSTGNYSLSSMTKFMKKEGLRNAKGGPVARSMLHKYLSNPFYCGKNEWNGQLYNGKQETLITKNLFDTVQEKLSLKFGGKPKYRKHLPVFKARIKCEECGGTITWECQKGHWYGHCNHYRKCSQEKWVKQEQIEEQLFPYFIKAAPKNEKIIKVLEDALRESHSYEIDYNTQKREELNNVVRVADKRIEGAYRDKLDGRMPADLCEKMIKEATKEKEEAIDSLGTLSKSRTAYYQAGYSIHELALHTKEIYESPKATVEDRRLLLGKIFSNLGLNEGKTSTNYTLAFEFLVNWMPKLNSTFELAKTGTFKNKTDDFSSVCTVVRGQGDSNP